MFRINYSIHLTSPEAATLLLRFEDATALGGAGGTGSGKKRPVGYEPLANLSFKNHTLERPQNKALARPCKLYLLRN